MAPGGPAERHQGRQKWVEGLRGSEGLTIPPSREKANIILELLVMENKPQCQTQIMIRHINTTAPFSPNTSTKICNTGWPYALPIVFWKFWMLNRKLRRTKRPKRAEKPTEEMTPIGADQEAFLVSSERWAEASKPVKVYCDMSAPQQATYAGLALILHPTSVPVAAVPSLNVANTNLALWCVGAFAKTAIANAVTPNECRMIELLLR